MPQPIRDQVFISYSHKDTKWRDELEIQLKPYLRDGSIMSWSDKQIHPGSQWFAEINSALTNTKVAVLLVTPAFIASDFIHEHELGPLLKEAARGGVKILWVPVRESGYKKTPLKDCQAAVLDPSKPLAAMTPAGRDKAWVKICEEIERAVKKPREPQALSVDQSHSDAPHAAGQELPDNVHGESQREIMRFLMDKRQELDSRPELLTVIRLLRQEWEAKRGKGSPPEGPKNQEEGNRWRELPQLLEKVGTFLEYHPATFRKAYGFFSEEVLLCAESSLLWPPKERYDESFYWRSFNKFVKATREAGYAIPL